MKRSVLIAAAALLAASAAHARVGPPRSSEPERCAVAVGFGSYGPGIDLQALLNIERRLRADRAVRNFIRRGRGREGEVTLCIYVRAYKDAAPLARRLRGMLPPRPRGPINVLLNGDSRD